uniref:Uncharacterized protein n=1 Tax=Magallana gigas TaxID=29159 RepID=K1R942_MAGGI
MYTPSETLSSASLSICACSCGDSCKCFSFNSQTKMCRLHRSCDCQIMTVSDTGWRFYNNPTMRPKEHCNASDSPSCKNRRSVIGRMSLQEIDKPEGINQSINTEVQVPASRHNNETDKEKDTPSSMIETKKADKTNLQTNINNQNSIKSYASALTTIEKSEARRESENTERSDWLSRKYPNKDTKSAFTGYTFVRGKRRTQRIVLANIKARGSSFEDVKTEIIKWCEDRGVNVSGIFLLVHRQGNFPLL